MNRIDEDIKNSAFSNLYLLYGQEDYLRVFYRDKLKHALLTEEDQMNYAYFEGKELQVGEVQSIANTMPFFSEHRVVIVENSGLLKTQSDMSEFIATMPDTTILIFVEAEIDKRSKLYKAIQKQGVVVECNGLQENDLKRWVYVILKKNEKKMTEANIMYLIEKVGADMNNLLNELDKLIAYAEKEEIITKEMIDDICVAQVEGKIFQMIDAISTKNQEQAMYLYHDLLALREKPMSVLFLLVRHFNILLQVKEMVRLGTPNGQIASTCGVPPFAVKKYIAQSKNFKTSHVKKCIESCMDVEYNIKTGLLLDQIGVELLLVSFSSIT